MPQFVKCSASSRMSGDRPSTMARCSQAATGTLRLSPKLTGLPSSGVAGSTPRATHGIAAQLPAALFLSHLLLALYWVYDDSAEQARTRRLLDRGLALVKLALPLARLPLLRKSLAELLALVAEVRP